MVIFVYKISNKCINFMYYIKKTEIRIKLYTTTNFEQYYN